MFFAVFIKYFLAQAFMRSECEWVEKESETFFKINEEKICSKIKVKIADLFSKIYN